MFYVLYNTWPLIITSAAKCDNSTNILIQLAGTLASIIRHTDTSKTFITPHTSWLFERALHGDSTQAREATHRNATAPNVVFTTLSDDKFSTLQYLE